MVARCALLSAGAAALLALSCTPPYDLDGIFCQGHGQCPTGYHCDQGEGAAVESPGVCVLGESEGAAPVAMVVARIDLPAYRQSFAMAGALVTGTASVDRIEEAVYEDVLAVPLLIEPARDGGRDVPRLRPTGANLYSASELGYENVGDPTPLALELPGLSGIPVGLPGLPADSLEPRFPIWAQACGTGGQAGLGDMPVVLREGDVWQASPLFPNSFLVVEGPPMPRSPVPEGDLLVAGRVLLPHGKALTLRDVGRTPGVDTSDVFLVLGPDFGDGAGPDCGETQCDDGQDNDGDRDIDCDDDDCQGQLGRRPGEPEPLICPESSCNDGKDNDGDGAIDCDDPDCPSADANGCAVDSGEVLALPIAEDGSVEVLWEQLPPAIQDGWASRFQMAWGRTRRTMVFEPEEGIDSAVLASANWVVIETIVLDPSQYLVSAEPVTGAALGQLQFQARSMEKGRPFDADGGYVASVADGFGHVVIVGQAQPEGPVPLLPAADGSLTVAYDPISLCRGLGMMVVYPVGVQPAEPSGDNFCADCGVASIDYRRAPLACDQVAIGAEAEGSLNPSQVLCGSFPSSGPESRVHRFTLQATAGSTYVIEALAGQLDSGNGLDTKLSLFKEEGGGTAPDWISDASDGVRTGVSGDDYCGSDARLVWQCHESGSYILQVQPSGEGEGGSYKLVLAVQ